METLSTDTAERPSPGDLPARDRAAAARTLREDGVVLLPGALGPGALADVEQAVEESLGRRTAGAVDFYPREKARFFQDRSQAFLPLARRIGLPTMLRVLWGASRAW